nr:ribonuclease H-like domain-containing protein [Tanacetum cinerariifolium]
MIDFRGVGDGIDDDGIKNISFLTGGSSLVSFFLEVSFSELFSLELALQFVEGIELFVHWFQKNVRKFEQWKFIIQQYLQHEHYALWKVIEFGDSYKAPPKETTKDKGLTGEVSSSTKKNGRTVAITAENMQKRKNDVKARTTLLLALYDEHHTDIAVASLSYDTVCAFIAIQPNGSQIKYEDISQIDDDDIEEMDIKWTLVLLSMKADRFWKKTGKKITIQGSDVAGFEKSIMECFNCHKMGHFARECRSPRSQDRGKRESYKKDPKVEEPAPKEMIAIDGIEVIWLRKMKL